MTNRSLRLVWCAVFGSLAFAGLGFAEVEMKPLMTSDAPTVIVALGAPGESDLDPSFKQQADTWQKICTQAGARCISVGIAPSTEISDHDQLKQMIASEPKEGVTGLWIVLIGHGTFDGKEAKFNLRGPDVSATELGDWLKPIQRPLVVVDCSSGSAPFLKGLSGKNRIVVTATRSGYEQNLSRFGQYFSEAMANSASDLDQDGQVSLLEAFLSASHRVAEFYKSEGRLVTEHALIDDNGDGLGTPADWFQGTRAVKKAEGGTSPDGVRANQVYLIRSKAEEKLSPEVRARRNDLELKISELREKKSKLPEDDYYTQLEKLLRELAQVYK